MNAVYNDLHPISMAMNSYSGDNKSRASYKIQLLGLGFASASYYILPAALGSGLYNYYLHA